MFICVHLCSSVWCFRLDRFTHVIIGGHCGIFTSYTVDRIGTILTSTFDYSCFHPEADTVVFFALKRFLDHNSTIQGSSIVINCPEADNVTTLLLEHHLISQIIRTREIRIYCAIHKSVDAKTGKPCKKAKEDASVEEFQALSSKVRMNFCIDVQKLYDNVTESDSFRDIDFPLESLAALSIYTGNDKSPGLRHITKTLALTVYSQACKDKILPSLVDSHGSLSNSQHCKKAFILLYARIYYHMYHVYIQKLDQISWESIVIDEFPNFKLLRDIGYQYAKGQLKKVPPVDGALDEIFARAIFQANEYNQVFESTINYLTPTEYGFEKCKGGLRPRLNKNTCANGNVEPEIIVSQVNSLLLPDETTENNCSCAAIDDEEVMDDEAELQNYDSSVCMFGNDNTPNLTAENIFKITLGQIDDKLENNISSLFEKDRQSQVESRHDDDSSLFGFDEWLQDRRS